MSLVLVLVFTTLTSMDRSNSKLAAYECGYEANARLDASPIVKYYLVALLYLLFDIEIALILPVISVVLDSSIEQVLVVLLFLWLLMLAYAIEWSSGSLRWLV
nr:NADH dehydrogenase subunit 3 [Chroodactylon ornatum]